MTGEEHVLLSLGSRTSVTRRVARQMRIHDEVSDALAAGRPVVALESTIITHGLPRPGNLEVAREFEAAVRAAGAVPATIARRRRRGADRARRRGARGDRLLRRRRQVRRPRPRAGRRPRRRTARPRSPPPSQLARRAGIGVFATGGLGGVHREARETLGRVGRSRHARTHPGHRRLRRGEVDPRRRRHARAPGDAQRHRARLRHGRVPGLLPRRLRLPGAVAGRLRRRGGRRDRARGPRSAARRRSWSPTRCPAAEQLDPRAARPGAGRRARGAPSARARPGKDVDAVPARLLPPRDRRGEPRGQRRGSCCATPSWRRGSPPRCERRRRRRPDGRRGGGAAGPLAHGSDAPAAISLHQGGSGANVAAWLAAAGRRCRVRGSRGRGPARGCRGRGARRASRSRSSATPCARPAPASCSCTPAGSAR